MKLVHCSRVFFSEDFSVYRQRIICLERTFLPMCYLDVKRACKDFWGKVALRNIVRQEM